MKENKAHAFNFLLLSTSDVHTDRLKKTTANLYFSVWLAAGNFEFSAHGNLFDTLDKEVTIDDFTFSGKRLGKR